MNWYYESSGKQSGPVTEAELDRLLAEGKVTPETLVWREGLAGWAPMRAARPAPSSIPSMHSPPPVTGSGAPQPGTIQCTLTGKFFPPSEIVYIEGKPYSAEAKPQIMQSLQGGGSLPASELTRSGPAWEQREQLGFFKAIVETIKAVLMTPGAAFAGMRRTGGLGSPIVFWLLTAGIASVVAQLYGMVFQGVMMGAMGAQGGSAANQQLAAMFGANTAMQGVFVVLAPLIGLAFVFIYAGLSHLCVKMLKASNHGFEVTLRTYCYAFGSAGVLGLVPICGGLIGLVWGLVAYCIGLAKAHDTTDGKGVAAALLPLAACCVLGIGAWAIFAALIFGGVSASQSINAP